MSAITKNSLVPRYVIFDFDGVIIDSEPAHEKAMRITLDHFSISYHESLFDQFKGIPDDVFLDLICSQNPQADKQQLFEFKRVAYKDIFSQVELVDGFLTFAKSMKERGFKLAIASSTQKKDLLLLGERVSFDELFDVIITANDTQHHKPHPEPYVKAMKLLNCSVDECLVIEDSPNGIRSAKAAGCFVIGLTTSFNGIELLNSGADVIVQNYQELDGIILQARG